jgi:hypothetical protein
VQGTIKADISFATLTSYTQYRDERTPYYGDLDATALPFFGINVNIVDKTFSQEFLLNSKSGSRLQWTVGANYFQYRDTWDVNASFGDAPFVDFGGSSTKTKSYAAFADATYQLADRLFVTGGLRYSHDIVDDAYFKTGRRVRAGRRHACRDQDRCRSAQGEQRHAARRPPLQAKRRLQRLCVLHARVQGRHPERRRPVAAGGEARAHQRIRSRLQICRPRLLV